MVRANNQKETIDFLKARAKGQTQNKENKYVY